ncbi:MAG: hypothetical protein RQ867_06935 [Mariprofundaceae bacterium]|nr:hypothetical protein [Mariprofundaceae bacterium]
MRAMSKERDIDDILESLNQLLREGESHNDDHVEEDISVEEIEAKLHELDEEIGELESEPILSEPPAEAADEAAPESGPEPESEPDPEPVWEQDAYDGPSDFDGYSDEEEAEDEEEEPAGSPISIQRVVLTEEMLVNNPQGNLLTIRSAHGPSSAEAADMSATGSRAASAAQESDRYEPAGEAHRQLHVDHRHLEQLLEQVADDVMQQLRHELPILIRRSLYHHLAEMSKEQDGEGHEENSEE